MSTMEQSGDVSLGAIVLGRVSSEQLWPFATQWRAAVPLRNEFRSVEWAFERAKAVPLSSRLERALLDAVRIDDGRAVLAQASEPGEHRVAAATLGAFRLAATHPDRALRFLAWLRQGPDDPKSLRFLRRYLPQTHVLVQLEPDLGVAMPLSRTALDLLTVELLRETGQHDDAEHLLAALSPSAPVAVARASLRLALGDEAGAQELARDRPIVDDVTAILRVLSARASDHAGDHEEALSQVATVLEHPGNARPIERAALEIRGRALRALGRDVEAGLVEADLGLTAAHERESSPNVVVNAPEPPLFGKTVADAMDDAWARVKRQPCSDETSDESLDPESVASFIDEVVALIQTGQLDAAETKLLGKIDCVDERIDAGAPVVDDFFVVLAGMFDQQSLLAEEIATLERLRAAHQRAGSMLPNAIQERLVEARSTLDSLA